MGQVTVLPGPERRRRWGEAQRLQILAEAFSPGACAAQVARRYDISTGLLYTWRRKFLQPTEAATASPETGFVKAVVVEDERRDQKRAEPAVIVDLARGRVSIFATATPALAAAILKALVP